MNKEQFIYWLKGFTSAIDLPTSGQWDTIVSELDKIKDCPDYGSSIDVTNALKYSGYTPGASGTPNTSITTTSNEPVTYTLKDDSKDSKN